MRREREGDGTPPNTHRRLPRRWLRAALLVAVGALLLAATATRLAPYVGTRLETASLLSPASIPAPPDTESGDDSPGDAASTSPQPLTDAEDPVEAADANGSAGHELASVPLVPTPPAPPMRLVIPGISVDAPVVPVSSRLLRADGVWLAMPRVPSRRAVGWQGNSAPLGVPGNTVLTGHNAGHGEVFRDLYQLEVGDPLIAYSGETPYVHTVSALILVREEDRAVESRRRNASYVESTKDERLTLVTCHPYGSLRYRLIIVAHPGVNPTGVQSRREPGED